MINGVPPDAQRLETTQQERAAGAVVAAAAADALGAPYELQPPLPDSEEVGMIGGGVLSWQPGEWTDETAMAIVQLESLTASLDGELEDFHSDATLDRVARGWYSWSISTPDIGALTSTVIGRAGEVARAAGRSVPTAEDLRYAALHAHEELPLIAGNGALGRTHATVLPHLLDGDDGLHRAIEAVCRLTHVHIDVVEACLLWGFGVRHAVLTGEVDVRHGLGRLREERRVLWEERIEEAETATPGAFGRNGWVVHAFQAAWSAVHHAGPIPADKFAQRDHLVTVLDAAIRAGYDTDTVAGIAGSMIGAALGPKAVPPEWRRMLFGWPQYEADDLEELVARALAPLGRAAEHQLEQA